MNNCRNVALAIAFLITVFCELVVPAHAQTTVAGTTAGQFSVSETGAATYRIPIQVPPGIAGMEPRLELVYNSQGGNGLLGMGWNLSGLSSIGRCVRTMAQDGVRGGVNYDANDRFCMDGQRLILVSGTYGAAASEYRTEIESFSKITAYGTAGNGPAYFIVKTKAGQTIEYGNTADSRVEAEGKTTAQTWATNRISDVKGNAMTFAYNEDSVNGEFGLASVSYAGNSVVLTYETRSDVQTGYRAGSKTVLSKRLKEVKTLIGANVVQRMTAAFGLSATTQRSLLTSIQVCDPLNNCLPSLQFSYGVDANSFAASPTPWPLPAVAAGYMGKSDTAGTYVQLVDLNGDGLQDLYASGQSAVYLNTGSGFSTSSTSWPLPPTAGTSGYMSRKDANGQFMGLVDLNGDGLPDFYASGQSSVWLNTGAGFFGTPTSWPLPANALSGGYMSKTDSNGDFYALVDLNGDGLPDFYASGRSEVYLNTGTGFATTATIWPLPAAANAAGYMNKKDTVGQFMGLIDLNGDGLLDFFVANANPAKVWLNTGTGFASTPINWPLPAAAGGYMNKSDVNGDIVVLVDLNGDGLPDLYTSWSVWFNTGNGFASTSTPFPMPTAANSGGYVTRKDTTGQLMGPVDLNSDGLPDFYASGQVWTSTANRATMLVGVSSATQSSVTISYAHAGVNSTYTRDSGTPMPWIDLQIPLYLVSQVQQSNGVGGTTTSQYTYGGLKVESGTGRGTLGFRWMKRKELATNIESYTEFRQDFPFVGIPVKSETRLAVSGSAGLLKRTTATPGCKIPQTAAACSVAPGNRYFPYLTSNVEESWELNGTAYPSITTSYLYAQNPVYGDPTQISVTNNSDGSSKTTLNEYWPVDNTNWILGRLKKATVTSVGATGAGGGAGSQALGLTINPGAVSVQRNAAGNGVVSVTATVSGGYAPYTFNWARVSGTKTVIANGITATPTFTAPVAWGENFTETMRVTLTDSVGGTVARDVGVNYWAAGAPALALTVVNSPGGFNPPCGWFGPFHNYVTSTPTATGGYPPYQYTWTIVPSGSAYYGWQSVVPSASSAVLDVSLYQMYYAYGWPTYDPFAVAYAYQVKVRDSYFQEVAISSQIVASNNCPPPPPPPPPCCGYEPGNN